MKLFYFKRSKHSYSYYAKSTNQTIVAKNPFTRKIYLQNQNMLLRQMLNNFGNLGV